MLDGISVIESLRLMPIGARLPIICVAAMSRRSDIGRLAACGITDYVLKPIGPKDFIARVQRVFTRSGRAHSSALPHARRVLLLVDRDPNFVTFASQFLDRDFEVLTAGTGLEAAGVYADSPRKPGIVVLGDNLPVLGETKLAQVIRSLAIADASEPPSIFLLSEAEQPPEVAQCFSVVMRRSFVPGVLVAEFRRFIHQDLSAYERLELLWRDGVRTWLLSAMQESLGVMIGREVSAVTWEDADMDADMAMARIELLIEEVDFPVYLEIACKIGAAAALATAILGSVTTFDEGGGDILCELANTVAGRVVSVLSTQGFRSHPGLPSTSRWNPGSAESDGSEVFCHSPSVGTFMVRLFVGNAVFGSSGH